MSDQHEEMTTILAGSNPTVAFGPLFMDLSRGGKVNPQMITSLIEEVAPSPGRVVHIHTTKLEMQLSGFQPVIFSAIDAATNLQIAQIYFAMTSAAALSFVDFVSHGFPFPISRIQTRQEAPFHISDIRQSHRDVPALIRGRGFLHSFVAGPSGDALFSATSNMVFGKLSEELRIPAWSGELQKSLSQFLFFHNNYRFVPWLEGKTPLQKLKMFAGYEGMHSFSVTDLPDKRVDSVSVRTGEHRNHALKLPLTDHI